MPEADWRRAFALEELPVGGSRLFRDEDHQIAVFRAAEEDLFAVDNRCPHEGYPLTQGYVKDCLLTCAWHNYKFDIRDGSCIVGEEAVRAWPTRINEAFVEIDVAGPDPDEERARIRASLAEGLLERRMGQVARDLVRLLDLGADPIDLVFFAAAFDAERAEWGTTHVLPLAADLMRHIDRVEREEALLPLLQAYDMASDSLARRPRREQPAPVPVEGDAAEVGARLRALVEDEDAVGAEGLLRGALAAGFARDDAERWLLGLCADHFLDFGHALIYTTKAFDLLDRVGFERADAILPALVFRITNGTREDTLPPWKDARDALERDASSFESWHAKQPDEDDSPEYASDAARQSGREPLRALLRALVEGSCEDGLAALATALSEGVGIMRICDALAAAAAERLSRFDVGIDRAIDIQEGWLHVTHRLTFAHAVREACERWPGPDVFPLLYQAARFICGARPLDAEAGELARRASQVVDAEPEEHVGSVLAAIARGRPETAVALVEDYLAADKPTELLRMKLEDLCCEDSAATRPIVVAHLIKTTAAAFDEHRRIEHERLRALPILGLVRLLASPVNERFLARLGFEARNFVLRSRVPRLRSR